MLTTPDDLGDANSHIVRGLGEKVTGRCVWGASRSAKRPPDNSRQEKEALDEGPDSSVK